MGWNYQIRFDDEGSSRMIYEGCPNQNPNAENVPEHSINEEKVALRAHETGQK
jgi:hypothetical protein